MDLDLDHHGDIPLGVAVQVFPERFKCRRKDLLFFFFLIEAGFHYESHYGTPLAQSPKC